MTAFSDFPFPDALPDFPARADVLAYPHAYADRFRLREHVRFGAPVESIAPAPDVHGYVRSPLGDPIRQTIDRQVSNSAMPVTKSSKFRIFSAIYCPTD